MSPRLFLTRSLSRWSRNFTSASCRLQDLHVGEMEGSQFRIEPLKRIGEDIDTIRARLLWQSRKRGISENELLLSTFAKTHLHRLSMAQLKAYDSFLDENDWDIFYWATQDPATAQTELQKDKPVLESPREGEWAQTVGTFKAAYRPVPLRWKDSEILKMFREHVKERSKDGPQFMPS